MEEIIEILTLPKEKRKKILRSEFSVVCVAEWSRNHEVLSEGSGKLSFGLGYPCFVLLEKREIIGVVTIFLYHLFTFFGLLMG